MEALAEIANASVPESPPLNGHSFTASLFERGSVPRKWAYSEASSRRRYVRTKNYKLYSTGEFFDMDSDPDEKQALAEHFANAEVPPED